jgi:hypothetical protein
VNVAKRLDGEQVGFLVPAKYAAQLLERARKGPAFEVDKARSEVGRQLDAWQAAFYDALKAGGFRATSIGPYLGLESAAPWFTRWASTNADAIPPPRTAINATRCTSDTGIFVSDRILTGRVDLSLGYYKSVDLNAFQFATYVSDLYRSESYGGRRKRLTPAKCQEDFVTTGEGAARPLLRVVWCARAYREFEGLYDVSVTAVTQDRDREALVSRLLMRGASYANAQALGRRFLDAIEVAR